jgi:hypothetical protein
MLESGLRLEVQAMISVLNAATQVGVGCAGGNPDFFTLREAPIRTAAPMDF